MRLRIFENFEEEDNEFEKVNGDAISEVISSRTVRNELDKYCDKYYGDGTYVEEFNGKEIRHNITSVRYTVEDVLTDVLGNPGIWDIICHVDIQWIYDEDTDTTGTQEYFSFYYDPVTDTIVDEKDIHTMEQDLVALTDDFLDKTESVRRPRRRYMKESADRKWLNTELSKEEFAKLRTFLKSRGIKYEPSEAGNLVHVEIYCNSNECKAINDFINTLNESYRRSRRF